MTHNFPNQKTLQKTSAPDATEKRVPPQGPRVVCGFDVQVLDNTCEMLIDMCHLTRRAYLGALKSNTASVRS